MSLLSQLADKSCSGSLEDDEFVLFYKMLTQREDVLTVFQEFSSDGQTLSHRDLEDFLREEQLEGDNVQQHAMHLIEQYEPSETGMNTHQYQYSVPVFGLSHWCKFTHIFSFL